MSLSKTTEENENIFTDYIIMYQTHMFRLAKGILRNDTNAEDAVSESICKAYAQFGQLKDKTAFKAWIMRIVVNESYRILKKNKHIILVEDYRIYESGKRDNYKELWDIIINLKEEFRIVVILFYYEEFSVREISNMLKIPEGTVKSRLNRSRETLKKVLLEGDEVNATLG